MAVDADAAEPALEGTDFEPETYDDGEDAVRRVRPTLIACVAIITGLAALIGWLGYQDYQSRQVRLRHDLFLQAARQAALNLTTISYTEADADVARILDSAVGGFRNDFQQRSQAFVGVVNEARSTSVGTIIDAGVESERDNEAKVLVAVNVSTSLAGTPEPQPRAWRMRVTVQPVGGGAKVSNVEFVP